MSSEQTSSGVAKSPDSFGCALGFSEVDSFHGNSVDPAAMQERPCPICGVSDCAPVLVYTDFQFFSDSRQNGKRTDLRTVRCLGCSAVYMNPCYSTLGFQQLFAEAGRSYGAAAGRDDEQANWLGEHGLLVEGNVALDVGTFDGRFLQKLPSNMTRIGVDIDQSAIERGNASGSDIQLLHGDFETFETPQAADVITLFHVLEHLQRPIEVLKRLHTIAAPGAFLVVEVPILDYASSNDVCGFFSVQHTTHFSATTLAKAVARAGWTVVAGQQMADYNGHRILATRAAARAESQTPLESRDDAHLSAALADKRRSAMALIERLETLDDAEEVIVWGGGLHTETLYQMTPAFSAHPQRRWALVDSDATKQGKSWRGIRIHHPDALDGIDWTHRQLLVSSYAGQPSIRNAAIGHGVPEQRICTLYDEIRNY